MLWKFYIIVVVLFASGVNSNSSSKENSIMLIAFRVIVCTHSKVSKIRATGASFDQIVGGRASEARQQVSAAATRPEYARALGLLMAL